MMFEAEQRGEQRKSISVIQNMLSMDFSLDIISQITGLALEEIKEIQKEIEEC